MTAASAGHRLRPEPLETQIRRAEQRLLDRRRRLDASAAALEQSVRRRITSPSALLLAGGLGFVAADLAPRVFSGMARADAGGPSAGGLFAGALSLVTLVHALLEPGEPAAADCPRQPPPTSRDAA